ncbi:MAG: cytochrome b [Sphingobium sp.]|uniref:cytochrome b n=1 Tax=Sphingobium sp. TaxID=1912891 RepID=UPI0029AC4B56|nr:cytochrome b [Sphingobium sp.]MDX3911693.1 cytochrome b [Sphingobium sp.]
MRSAIEARYSGAQRIFHWVTALAMLVILVLGWIMQPGKDGPEMATLWEIHKTFGVLVFLITAARLVWRHYDPPPPAPPGQPDWDHKLANMTYAVFFLALLWFPATGYVYSTAGGHPPILFGMMPTPQLLPIDKEVAAWGKSLHRLSQWPLYALILLHLAGVFYHVSVRRDGMLDRMLPAQKPYGKNDDK